MDDKTVRIIESTQEQAAASWVTQLNQMRINELIQGLESQKYNFSEAMAELAKLKAFIGEPSHILGSFDTKHGEIAEHLQVNISNARNLIEGFKAEYTFDGVGRTAPEDYLHNGIKIQSKFCNGPKNTLDAIKKHLDKYPDFVKNGNKYDIPKNQYEEIQKILKLSKTNPSALSKSDMRILNSAKEFQEKTGLSFGDDINHSIADYEDAQVAKVHDTVSKEEKSIEKRHQEKQGELYKKSQPSLDEGLKAAKLGAALEGGVVFCTNIAKKRKEKNLCEFALDDWIEVGLETGKGAAKGGIRGGAVYTLTNFTTTPANIASAYVTAAFGISSQLKAYRSGDISKEDFIINSEVVCLDTAVSAIGGLVGEMLIPIPVLGAMVGNIAAQMLYEVCKNIADEKEQALINNYQAEIAALNQALEEKYKKFLLKISYELQKYKSIEQLAFDADINKAFANSITLAKTEGVSDSDILKTISDIDNYYTN